jgi:hypothetical protein
MDRCLWGVFRISALFSGLAGFLISGRRLLCVFFVLAPDLVWRLSVFRVDGVIFYSACVEFSLVTCWCSWSTLFYDNLI